MRGRCTRFCLLGLLVGLVTFGCAGAHTQELEVFEPLPSQPFAKFLVLGIDEDGRVRRLFENAFVAELTRQGLEGVQSYRFIYEEKAITVPNVQRAVQESGADALITVRAIEVNLQTKIGRPMQRDNLEFDVLSKDPERRLLPQRGKVTLLTNIYQAANRQLVLSATSRVTNPDSVETVGREVCRETVASLAKSKLIRQ